MDNDELPRSTVIQDDNPKPVRRAKLSPSKPSRKATKKKKKQNLRLSIRNESTQNDLQLNSAKSMLSSSLTTKRGPDDESLMPPANKPKLDSAQDTNLPEIRGLPTKSKYGWTEVDYKSLPATMDYSGKYDPFLELAELWSAPNLHRTSISMINGDGSVNKDLSVSMILPKLVALPPTITLFWENNEIYIAKFGHSTPIGEVEAEVLTAMRRITAKYLQATSTRLQGSERDYVALFIPDIELTELEKWADEYDAVEQAIDVYARDPVSSPIGILRDGAQYSEPRIFHEWVVSPKPKGASHIEIACEQLPKRRNYLHPPPPDNTRCALKKYTIPASSCTVDKLPAAQAIFGRFISPILDRIQATMVAEKLNNTFLKTVGIQNLAHVITAITAPNALAETDYQKYEFYGDSVLKFTVACQQFLQRTTWTEGELSASRDAIVNNKRLAYAAIHAGLYKFILTDRFTPKKWEAPRISMKLAAPPKTETQSRKVMADAVESLIGAALLDGGMLKAQACLKCFLPDVEILTDSFPTLTPSGRFIEPVLTDLIGYDFLDGSMLLEALTHSSLKHISPSYERLEWLGDAVLDTVVVDIFRDRSEDLSQGYMTMLKHAVVNANLLGFCCMDFGFDETVNEESRHNLTRYFRYTGSHIGLSIKSCWKRHNELRKEIRAEMENSNTYPWDLLARLHCDKIFSDITESTLGAIFVDSGGNIETCRAFLEKLGLLSYLRHILSDQVSVEHPRNRSQAIFKHAGTLIFKHQRVPKMIGKRADPNEATYQSTAIINGQHLGEVAGCISAEEADIQLAGTILQKVEKGCYDDILGK
ncbi:Dicer-like protein 2 [Penicillium taxi]|uniref:Dicer-like protein 2 n=1 Tax=Penicillium taxi TaxID=168475 RepID=UPI00254556A2|nr:Dicer-like protein 2 [Penicillium taxi]KAJ5894905.1 Dicer-like protein 2 [Penicillium taxi]